VAAARRRGTAMAAGAWRRWLWAVLAPAGVAACGGSGGASIAPAVASGSGALFASTLCSASASSASAGGSASSSSSCVVVLSDGRRLRCTPSLVRGSPRPAVLERSAACKPMSPLVIPPALREPARGSPPPARASPGTAWR